MSVPVSIETNATTTEQQGAFNIDYLIMLSNDGTDSIVFNIGGGSTSQTGAAFTLKAGDKLQDLNMSCKVLYWKAVSGSQAFRAWGLK